MHVVKYLGYATLGLFGFAAAAITQYPGTDFAHFTGSFLGWGSIILLALVALVLLLEDRLGEGGKTFFMSLFLLTVFIPTVYATGSFIHEDQTSWSNGEVHYHADYTVIIQENGEYKQLDLIDPSRFCEETTHESTYMCSVNDRTGSVAYHEHDDNRIHLEGVFRTREEATLSAFFQVIGGTLTDTELVYPTNEKVHRFQENGKTLKIIVQRGVGGSRGWCALSEDVPVEDQCIDAYTDTPATSPEEYVISPYQQGPPIDDIWVIYDTNTVEDALQNLQRNGEYQGFTLAGMNTEEEN